jgi:hypothetical protein
MTRREFSHLVLDAGRRRRAMEAVRDGERAAEPVWKKKTDAA